MHDVNIPLCLALKPLNNGLTCFLLINTFMFATSAPGIKRTSLLSRWSAMSEQQTFSFFQAIEVMLFASLVPLLTSHLKQWSQF